MEIVILEEFAIKLSQQVAYISTDKPKAAKKFKEDILQLIENISNMPLLHRQSIYFDDENIREAIFKGYKVVYRINISANRVEVFGFINQQKEL